MSFDEHFAKLNDEQKEAVEHIDGPLLVIAGPGTGKTQLLSSRVAYILQNTDADSKDILCLTFTNKAALNMHERIIQITSGQAHNVSVRTFHSFASEIMNMYPEYFWNNARLSTAPDAVQQDIIETILASLPLDNPLALKFAGKFTVTSQVKQALKLAKEAGLTPDKLRALLQANLSYIDEIEAELTQITSKTLSYKTLPELQQSIQKLPDQNINEQIAPLISLASSIKESLTQAINLDEGTNKTKNTGKWKQSWIQTVDGHRGMHKERGRNLWWLELSDIYDQYRTKLHERGYYDYADMLVEVLSQIEQHPDLRADIQERYLYVMIDEFQDTNPAQLRLAHLVADHHTSNGQPNIMVVGDDDQSIFKFNGAELENLLSFTRSYQGCKKIVLTDNYRSSQEVLDLAGRIIDQANDRLVKRDSTISKKLVAKNDFSSREIKHYHFQTIDEQLSGIAEDIRHNYTSNETIAVLARGHASLRTMAAQLIARNIPVAYEQQQNILEHPIVEQSLYLAKLCLAINNGDIHEVNANVSKTLRSPMWSIDSKTLWEIALDNFYDPDWLTSLENHSDENISKLSKFFIELSRIIDGEPLAVAIEYIVGLRKTEVGVSPLKTYFLSFENKNELHLYLHGLSALHYLRNCAQEFSSEKRADLESYIDFIELQMRNEEVITDESPFISGRHAVSLLTVHKAKGLEFDRVYVIDAVDNNWKPRGGKQKSPTNLPLQPNGDDSDDYIRLMFVAVTRAKRDIIISSYRYAENNAEVLPTPIISEIIEAEPFTDELNPIEILEQSLSWPRLTKSNEKAMLSRRLETYSLSVTHLINFLDVTSGGPQLFLERNLLRIPEGKSSTLAHGTATHAALEHAQKLVNMDEFSLDAIKDTYDKSLLREHLPNAETQRYIDHGHKLLDKLFTDNFLELNKGSAPEQNISEVHLGKARLGGKLDRIDDNGDTIVVSDYKTGNPLSSFTTKDKALELKAWKQRTQLIYYALLLKQSPHIKTDSKTIDGQMIYLDAETRKDLYRSYTPSSEEIERLSLLIQAVWNKIIDVELPDISKYPQDYSGVVQFEEDLLRNS